MHWESGAIRRKSPGEHKSNEAIGENEELKECSDEKKEAMTEKVIGGEREREMIVEPPIH